MAGSRAPASGLVLAVIVSAACAVLEDEPLPATPRPALFREPPSVCISMPVPPLEPPEASPLDPRSCLPPEHIRGLPVYVTVTDGRVTEFDFYDQCSGERFQVPDATRDCIRRSLATWRYAVWPTCPGEHTTGHDMLYLRPVAPASRVAGNVQRGCNG